ncbi:MAG TPA: hypothetical protein VHM65_08635 [Candidatus Lustribacter sp.]|nr:hypothetical protein [Candidatus Lustribacter sp.]
MTPFFEPATPPDEPEPEPHYVVFPGQPPENVVPARLDWDAEILREPDTVLVLTDVLAFPQGFSYRVRAWLRPGSEHHAEGGPRHEHVDFAPVTGWLLDGSVKIGAAWETDGASGGDDPFAPGDPAAPRQSPCGGSGGGLTADTGSWVYPLPEGHSLQLVFAWDARGIPETYVDVDLAELGAAAGRAEVLWPIPESPHEQGWFAYAPLQSGSAVRGAPSTAADTSDDTSEDPDGHAS